MVEDEETGEVRLYDEHGFEIVKDEEGNVHRFNKDGYEAFISPTGKITYKDKAGNHVRQTS